MLRLAAALNGLAALLHVGIVLGGPEWYRFFGAGEPMAAMAARGELLPTVVTIGIAAVLSAWAVYALSGAGIVRRLPFTRAVLVLVTAIYGVRALAGVPLAMVDTSRTTFFWVWSSAICTGYAIVHLLGLRQARSSLGSPR